MNGRPIFCPRCNNNKADYIARRDEYICSTCNYFFKIERNADPLRIFLSYGHDKMAFVANKIKKDLETIGHEVWYDLDRLKCGKDWEEYIQQGLEWVAEIRSKARFILLMTPHSIGRPGGFCLNELARAMEKQITIFPIMLQWSEPPLSICRIQWLDMRPVYCKGEITPKFTETMRDLEHALEHNKNEFNGTLLRLRALLDPVPFEASALMHIRRFVGREWMMEKINCWLNDEKAEKIFWITGSPGAGKSALASWLHFYQPNVKAFFLCKAPSTSSRGVYEPGDPRWCVRTIAFQLSAMLPGYSDKISQWDIERIVTENSAEAMFERLISEALVGIDCPQGQRAVVLVDGLDEVTTGHRNELAEFLVQQVRKTPEWLRVIITSRYEEPLISDLQRYEPSNIDAEVALNEKDHLQFIEREFCKFAKNAKLDVHTRQALLDKSESNFLYLEQLRDSLEKEYLSLDKINSFPKGLGEFYKHFFRRKFNNTKQFREVLYDKLVVILSVSNPLQWEQAEALFDWKKGSQIKDFKDLLGALFIYENNQIVPFHQSLVEWITNEEKAGDFWIRIKDGHKYLAQVGYEAYRRKSDILNEGELKCITELPSHLLAIGELGKLAEFLCDIESFITYFGNNIISYIRYWNSLCQADKEKRWSLADCSKFLSQQLETCMLLDEATPNSWESSLTVGRLFFELKEYDNARRMFLKSLSILPQDYDDATRARLFNEIGDVLYQMGMIDDAESNFRKALDIRQRIYTVHPDLAESINNYGHAFFGRGLYEKAMVQYNKALTMWRKLPDGPHHGEADSLNNVASCLDVMGKNDEAANVYKKGVEVLNKLKYFNWGIPICRNNYGNFLLRIGKADDALCQYQLSYELLLHIFGPEFKSTIQAASKIANTYIDIGQRNKADSLFKEIIGRCEKLFGDFHSKTIDTINLLGQELMFADKFHEARELFLNVVNRINKCKFQNEEAKSKVFHDLGAVSFFLEDFDAALPYFLKSMKLREEIYPVGHELILETYWFVIEIYVYKRDAAKGIKLAEKCHKTHISSMKCDTLIYYKIQNLLGRIFKINDQWQNAEKIYRETIENGERLLQSINNNYRSSDSRILFIAVAYNEIAVYLYMPAQKWIEAEKYCRRAVELMATQSDLPEFSNLLANLCSVFPNSGKTVDEYDVKNFFDIVEKSIDTGLSAKDKKSADQALNNIRISYTYLNDHDKARQYLLKSIRLREEIYPAGHPLIIDVYKLAIETYVQSSDEVKALELAIKCHKAHIPSMESDNQIYYEIQNLLGRIFRIAGHWQNAEKSYRETIECGGRLLNSKNGKPSSTDSRIFYLAVAYNEIAFHLYMPTQNWRKAELYFRRAIKLLKTQNQKIEMANLKLNLYTVLQIAGKMIDANEVKKQTNILKKAKDLRAAKGIEILRAQRL